MKIDSAQLERYLRNLHKFDISLEGYYDELNTYCERVIDSDIPDLLYNDVIHVLAYSLFLKDIIYNAMKNDKRPT